MKPPTGAKNVTVSDSATDYSGIATQARSLFGLDDLDHAPPALPMRVEQWWRTDHFSPTVQHTGSILIPFGSSPDMDALRDSVAAIVARHEALRSRLAIRQDRSVLIADDSGPGAVECISIAQSDIKGYREGGASALTAFLKTPFNLFEQTGFRFRAFADEDRNVTLAVLMHHYFGDAWSAQILRREIETLYAARLKKGAADLPPVTQYSEYARTQRKSLSAHLPARLAYWHKRLAGAPAPALPFDRQEDQSRRERVVFTIPGEVLAGLQAIAKAERLSLAMICFAAFELALAHWCGQNEIVSAANSIDRIKMQFRNTVGSLMSSIAVYSRISQDTPIREFLLTVAKTFYDSIGHQDLAYEQYEDIYAPPPPFCTTRFNFVPRQKDFFLGDDDDAMPVFDGVVKAPAMRKLAAFRDLHMFLVEYQQGLFGRVTYNPDFSFEKIQSFTQSFQRFLQKIAADPSARLGNLV